MQIREMTNTDKTRWIEMRRMLWPNDDPGQLEPEIDTFLADRTTWGLFIAEVNGESAGFAECRLRDSAAGCKTVGVGYLEAWYVDPKHRRQGVGAALIERCEEWARAQGASEMASDTTSEYPDSPLAHTKLGFIEVERHFLYRKDLG